MNLAERARERERGRAIPFKEAWMAQPEFGVIFMAKKDEGGSERGGIRPNVARASPRQSHCQCKKENDRERERDGRRQKS